MTGGAALNSQIKKKLITGEEVNSQLLAHTT